MALRAQTKQLKKEKYDLMQENKELKQANNLTVQTVVKSTRPAWGEAGVTQGVRTASIQEKNGDCILRMWNKGCKDVKEI